MRTSSISYHDVVGNSYRFDPSYHLSEATHVRSVLHTLPYGTTTVASASERVFIGNIFSRVFVKDAEHGAPYLAASDTVLANLDTGFYLSKKQASDLSYLALKKDWILVTCSGTLGNVTYTNKDFEGRIATHDLIRIVPNDQDVLRGCLFAFLSSKYGYYQLTQSSFGGVVKHINADHARSILVPSFPKVFQERVDTLIKESALLREEANAAISKARSCIDCEFTGIAQKKPHTVSIGTIISSHNTRFEGFYHTSENRALYDYITQNLNYRPLSDYVVNIFRPGIFKREYVANGVKFLGGADIVRAIPDSDKQLSFRQVERMPELCVKKGWMLVTCGGTIGNTVYIDNQLERCAISQHVMRIIPREGVKKGFLYAFLSSQVGYKLITLFSAGSVIPQVENHHLAMIPIPSLGNEKEMLIEQLVEEYVSKIELSKERELEAISLVEQEIGKWDN